MYLCSISFFLLTYSDWKMTFMYVASLSDIPWVIFQWKKTDFDEGKKTYDAITALMYTPVLLIFVSSRYDKKTNKNSFSDVLLVWWRYISSENQIQFQELWRCFFLFIEIDIESLLMFFILWALIDYFRSIMTQYRHSDIRQWFFSFRIKKKEVEILRRKVNWETI